MTPALSNARPSPSATPHHQFKDFGQSLAFRQTLIPILLTGGLILIALGTLHFIPLDNNPMTGLAAWLADLLILFGLLLWALCAANVVVVKHLLDAQREG